MLNALFSTVHFSRRRGGVAKLKFLQEEDNTATDYIVSTWSPSRIAAKQLDLFTAVPIVKGSWQKKVTAMFLQIIVASPGFPQYPVVSTRADERLAERADKKNKKKKTQARCQYSN